jgi:hypothetical protein
LIDAGDAPAALGHFREALAIRPASVLRVWYKLVQAAGQSLGLGRLFLGYRSTRRRLQLGNKRLVFREGQPRWLDDKGDAA